MFINQIPARKTDTDSSCDNSADLNGDQVQPKSTIVELIKKKRAMKIPHGARIWNA